LAIGNLPAETCRFACISIYELLHGRLRLGCTAEKRTVKFRREATAFVRYPNYNNNQEDQYAAVLEVNYEGITYEGEEAGIQNKIGTPKGAIRGKGEKKATALKVCIHKARCARWWCHGLVFTNDTSDTAQLHGSEVYHASLSLSPVALCMHAGIIFTSLMAR
jgi:hypothetical protein